MALSLAWGNNQYDLDLAVEFEASPDIKCRVNYAYRECGGVRLNVDNSMVAARSSADIVTFDVVDRQTTYLVYINLSTLRLKNKPKNASYNLSQGVLKLYSPFYDWPIL